MLLLLLIMLLDVFAFRICVSNYPISNYHNLHTLNYTVYINSWFKLSNDYQYDNSDDKIRIKK